MKLNELYTIIQDRKKRLPNNSYVTSLFKGDPDILLQKIGEEATEAIIAGKNRSKQRLIEETADLWFHSLVLLVSKDISIESIENELEKRHKKKLQKPLVTDTIQV